MTFETLLAMGTAGFSILISILLAYHLYKKERSIVLLGFVIIQIVHINIGANILLLPTENLHHLWTLIWVNLCVIIAILGYYSTFIFKDFSENSQVKLAGSVDYYSNLFVAIIVCVCLGFAWWSFGGTTSPLLRWISGEGSSLSKLRVESTYYMVERAAYTGQGVADFLRNYALPILVWTLILQVYILKIRKHKIPLNIVSLLSITGVLLLLVSSGQRWPLLSFIISSLIIIYGTGFFKAVFQKYKIFIWIFILCSTFFLGFLTVFLGRAEGNPLSVLNSLFSRIFIEQSVPLSYIIQNFPEPYSFKLGSTWLQDVLTIGPGPRVGFSFELNYLMGRTLGTAPPTLFGSLYINFGIIGLILGSFLWGVIGRILSELLKSSKLILDRVFVCMIVYLYIFAAGTDMTWFMINSAALLMLLFFMKIVFRWLEARGTYELHSTSSSHPFIDFEKDDTEV